MVRPEDYGLRLRDLDGNPGAYLPVARPATLYRALEEAPQGRAAITLVTCPSGHVTVLAFWDRSCDIREGSHSTFILPGRLTKAQAIAEARRHFPQIWARIDGVGMVVA
jgi:hypothetical protein